MQTNFESSTYDRQALVLPIATHITESWGLQKRLASTAPISGLVKARRDVLRGKDSENIAWLALVLSSLAVLVLSFWL